MVTINGNYREYKLDNGLLVALQETPTRTISGRLRVWHGALNEEKGEEGIAHFLEHTIITGGSQRYNSKESEKTREQFGSFNALTGLERTFFPVDMLEEDIKLFIEYISDGVFNPRFEENKVEEERQRVLRETADAKSNPGFKDQREYSKACFGEDSPHTYFILGRESVVQSASVRDLKKFHKRGYYPNNMDLILVGALPKNIDDLIEQNFGSFRQGNCKKIEFPRNSRFDKSIIIHTYAPELLNQENTEESSAELGVSFFAPTETDKDSYAMSMLTHILGGGGANSRLFTSVSQRKGLAYGIGAGHIKNNNIGMVYLSGRVHSKRANEAIDVTFEEMAKLRKDLVSQEDLEKIKRSYIYSTAKTFETNEGHVGAIELKMDKGLTPEGRLKKMNEVTPEKIRDVALRYFPEGREDENYIMLLRDPLKE